MLSRATKQSMAKELNDELKAGPSLFIVEYKGIDVKNMQVLRRKLKAIDSDFRVIKNTVLRIATKDTAFEQLGEQFTGPNAIAICRGEPAPVAKVFTESTKTMPTLVLKGGIVEGNMLSSEDIATLSRLPSREVLFAQLLGMLASPVSNFLGTLQQMQSQVVNVLSSLKDKKEEEEKQKA